MKRRFFLQSEFCIFFCCAYQADCISVTTRRTILAPRWGDNEILTLSRRFITQRKKTHTHTHTRTHRMRCTRAYLTAYIHIHYASLYNGRVLRVGVGYLLIIASRTPRTACCCTGWKASSYRIRRLHYKSPRVHWRDWRDEKIAGPTGNKSTILQGVRVYIYIAV